ncbi:hypothetical protein HOP50_05g35630 [Chloropicon primus]|uniref:At4g15545-like C-terminal domain-containing protein n=1 Tax=Chloropicon primus TaxID=1764295 RepID=A0A5B8MK78_9CHLO|nr:hypothetical protein A3770_05p35560 [Chloropicon primus]UPR00249.1 hypothetical protein HOP50_05g35630 [Chloropicon primus]|eukprot:QDZ21038.1 hypothetical protein A3770_05p35560 [Chloropicon primus]
MSRIPTEALPREILAVLPPEPYDQLDLAHRINAYAYTQKVAVLEAEAGQLRTQASQHKNHVKTLERRIENLVMEVNDANEKTKQVLDDQSKLVAEKNALIQTVKKLNRDVAKLESFKRHLLQTLQDEEDSKDSMNLGIDLASDRMISSVLSSASSPMMGSQVPMGATPMGANGAASPEAKAAGGSPVGAGTPKVDGKEFFRNARSRLGYDDFSQFLQNIKELNAGRQTREETLRKAQEIFKSQNADLYKTFEGLLSRHIPGAT